ncbi:tape measure protein [Leptospira interrogans]|uniref:tape measure protein n=1 Tax=Leptospira interrogans TaxID=173 RepID=UPI00046C74A8|nr:tape measure protein [Leptospira interrogans]
MSDQVIKRLSFKITADGIGEVGGHLSYLDKITDGLAHKFGSIIPQVRYTSESMGLLTKEVGGLAHGFETFTQIPDNISATSEQIQSMSKYLGVADDDLTQLISKTRSDFKLADEFERTARTAGLTDQEIVKIVEHLKTLKANPPASPIPPEVITPTLEQIQSMSKSLGISEAQLNKLISKTRSDFKLADEFKDTAKAAGLLDREIQSISGHIEQSKIKTVGWVSLMSGLAATGLTLSLSGFFSSALEQAGQLEKYETVLTTTLGSSKLAKSALQDVQEFAKTTPYEMAEVAGSYVKFANRGIVPTLELMTRFGDVAASQGKSFDQFTEAVLDATTGEFERMKEFGIRMSGAGNKVMVQFKDFKKSVDKTPESIKNALLELGKLKGVQGGMDQLSKTWGGLMSNLQDGIKQTIAIAGVFIASVLKPILIFFTDGAQAAARLRFALVALALTIGVGLVSASYAWVAALDAIAIAKVAAFGELIAIAAIVAASLATIYLALEDIYLFFEHGPEGSETYFGDLLKWFGLTDSELSDLHKGFQDLKITLGAVWDSFKEFIESDTGQAIKKVLLVIAGVVAAIAFLPATLVMGLAVLATVIHTQWDKITTWIKNAWDKTLDFLLDAAALAAKLLIVYLFPISALYLFRDEIAFAFDWIFKKIESIPFLKPLIDQLVSLKNAAKDIFVSILDSINTGLNSLFDFDGLKSVFVDMINELISQINSSLSSSPLLKRVFPQIPLIEARQFGGPIEPDKDYIVGEDGPELRTFSKPGTIIPNHEIKAALGSRGSVSTPSGTPIQFNFGNILISGDNAAGVASSFWDEVKKSAKENENEVRISLGLAPT